MTNDRLIVADNAAIVDGRYIARGDEHVLPPAIREQIAAIRDAKAAKRSAVWEMLRQEAEATRPAPQEAR